MNFTRCHSPARSSQQVPCGLYRHGVLNPCETRFRSEPHSHRRYHYFSAHPAVAAMSTHCDNRGRSSRSSSPGVDSDSGSKSSRTEHGRKTSFPLSIVFPDPPGFLLHYTLTDLCSKFTSLGIVPKNNQTPHPPASNYPQYQSLNSTTYLTRHSPPRGAVPSDTPNPHYSHNHHHQPSSKTHASQGRPASGSRLPTQLPSAGPVMSPVDYEPPAELSEPTIKKKRKRADARQLKVLNATYSRTAFPSTQEREPLAKALDMSARSVQIWLEHALVYTAFAISDS